MIEDITGFILKIIETSGLPGIAFAAFLENLFPPLPSEFILVFAGVWGKKEGSIDILILIVIASVIGAYIGNCLLYYFGKKFPKKAIHTFVRKYGPYMFLNEYMIIKAENYFEKKGFIAVFIAKFLPGIRSFISIPAGYSNMNFFVFSVYSLMGITIWNTILISAGYFIADQDQIVAYAEKSKEVILILVVIVSVVILGNEVRKLKIRKRPKVDSQK